MRKVSSPLSRNRCTGVVWDPVVAAGEVEARGDRGADPPALCNTSSVLR